MKSYKKIMPIFLIVALFGTMFYSLNSRMQAENEYETTLALARDYVEKGVVEDAVAQYEIALEQNPTLEICLEAGYAYLNSEELTYAKKWYENQLLEKYPKQPETYLFGIETYVAMGNENSAFAVYEEYLNRELYSEEVEDAIKPILYSYDLTGDFVEVQPFATSNDFAAVRYQEDWGYVDTTGRRKLDYVYVEAETFSAYAAVVDRSGNASYIGSDGVVHINENFILENDPDFGKVEIFRCIQSDMILAYNGDVWNYYSASTYEKLFGGFEDAYPITYGVGAVKNASGDWGIVKSDGEMLTDYIYDEILMDERDITCRTAAVIVRDGSDYILLDRNTGNQIGNTEYDDACAFYDSTYAAVKKGNTWLWVDETGTEMNLGEYDNAKSFCNGFAAVEINGKWGYIDIEGDLVIPCEFMDVGPFHTTGVAFVQMEDMSWRLLSLYRYNHD